MIDCGLSARHKGGKIEMMDLNNQRRSQAKDTLKKKRKENLWNVKGRCDWRKEKDGGWKLWN